MNGRRRIQGLVIVVTVVAVTLVIVRLREGDEAEVTARDEGGEIASSTTSAVATSTTLETPLTSLTTSTTSAEVQTTTTTEPSFTRLTLMGDGLGMTRLGDGRSDVVRVISEALGQGPDEETPAVVVFGYLRLLFGADDVLDCYKIHENYGRNLGLTTEEGIGLGATRQDLTAAYQDRFHDMADRFTIDLLSGSLYGSISASDDGDAFSFWAGDPECNP